VELDTHFRKLQEVSKKRQQRRLSIPSESVEKLGWKTGDRLKIQEIEGGLVITKVQSKVVQKTTEDEPLH